MGRSLTIGSGSEVSCFKERGQFLKRVAASRVQTERASNQFGPVRIERHVSNLAPVLNLPHIDLADRDEERGPSNLDLALYSELDILRDLQTLPGRNCRQNAFEHHIVGSLAADRFLHGNELGAGIPDETAGHPVVERGERNLTLKSVERIAERVGVDPMRLLVADKA